MDDSLRAQLYAAVVDCRRRLEKDLARQLEGVYGLRADGAATPSPAHLDAAGLADREAIRATLAHYSGHYSGHYGGPDAAATERFVRESAFTWLNRLAALKLMEHPSRALIRPSVGSGADSRGFVEFAQIAPAAMRGQPDGGYRLYLELLAGDLSLELGALFDRRPTALLFPGPAALAEVLERLNDPAMAAVWAEDETLGWVYQYFTPTETRRQARNESAAPRDSHELSFRNQFYTPRYIVAFLAENTLGRLWLGRRGGRSHLSESCPYLIHPTAPPTPPAEAPDPRTIRVLDPACGSGHFLLYCYDLLERIYAEAYDDAHADSPLRAYYPDRSAFGGAVPGLILAHNLHGIDIDRRAVQITRLALWLRAQRSYGTLGLRLAERPHPPQAAVVCAEPVPGGPEQLAEFGRALSPAALGAMLPDIWTALRGVEELGPLLRIERDTARIVAETKRALEALPAGWQMTLFSADRPASSPLPLRRADLDDEGFWDGAVERLRAALSDYAAVGPGARLFADDATEGVAFLDMLHEPFDVVLMNPPFGAPTPGSKAYLERHYPRTKHDLYAAFVERGLELLRPGGYLGAITSRTGFFLSSFQKWREEILLQSVDLVALADLGYGVLDTAMVETAAYVLEKVGGDR